MLAKFNPKKFDTFLQSILFTHKLAYNMLAKMSIFYSKLGGYYTQFWDKYNFPLSYDDIFQFRDMKTCTEAVFILSAAGLMLAYYLLKKAPTHIMTKEGWKHLSRNPQYLHNYV